MINKEYTKLIEVAGYARLAHFIDKLKKGYTAQDAADSVKMYLFDYADLAPGDEWMKRIIPFWMWARNNIPLQFKNLVQHPGKFAYVAKLKHAMEGGAAQSEEFEREPRPDWLRESFHARLPDRWSANGKPTIMKLGLPQEDIVRWLDPKEVGASITPALKLPAEYGFNKNFYFGSDIVPKGLDNDPSLATVKTDPEWKYAGMVPGLREMLNIKTVPDRFNGQERTEMDARWHHFYSSTARPMRETSRAMDPETSPVIRVLNWLGPARVYQNDMQRQQYFDTLNEIDRFQAILRKLQKEQVRGGIGRGTGM